jgi:molybdopterin molybdotransferase
MNRLMEIEIQLLDRPIAETIPPPTQPGSAGAWLEFRGVVRGEENDQSICALEYEAYPEMAVREIRRLLQDIARRHPCQAAKVIHRVGVIPVGETAIYVGVASTHRGEALAALAEFMDRLKQDVPIWKRQALSLEATVGRVTPCAPVKNQLPAGGGQRTARPTIISLDEAIAEIRSRCRSLPAVQAPLAEASGRVLRETVCAPEDLPPVDRSTRDGYAIRIDDASETFSVVDTIHAADWKPRQLESGEAVRIATGAALPCENLRVVMQEHAERDGDQLRIVRQEDSMNVRRRGEEVRRGQPLLAAGTILNAGALAILAGAGAVNPLVSPRLRIAHFTTGDEIVPPGQTPKPGQVRDSNSILIRGLLAGYPCDLRQGHLPEDFQRAKSAVGYRPLANDKADVLLISGGASVGETDFTGRLLEDLGFAIIFREIDLRPGRPLIFGANGRRVAFGLPGNPLSHFVCFRFAIATALAALTGSEPAKFLRGQLAEPFNDKPCPRETLWPARWEGLVGQTFLFAGTGGFPAAGGNRVNAGQECPVNPQTGMSALHLLPWASSGDITCLATANALVRIPANCMGLLQGTTVDFLAFGLPAASEPGGDSRPNQSSHRLDATTPST